MTDNRFDSKDIKQSLRTTVDRQTPDDGGETTSPQSSGRREFLGKSIGMAAIGAASLASANPLRAQDLEFPKMLPKRLQPWVIHQRHSRLRRQLAICS